MITRYLVDNKSQIFTVMVENGYVISSTYRKKKINSQIIGDTEEFFLNWLEEVELDKHFTKTIEDE